jgi:hypothetical protein
MSDAEGGSEAKSPRSDDAPEGASVADSRTPKAASTSMCINGATRDEQVFTAFLQTVHQAFPAAVIDFQGPMTKLDGPIRLCTTFKNPSRKNRAAFRQGRQAFVKSTQSGPTLTASANVNERIQFEDTEDQREECTARVYDNVEIDALVKIPYHGEPWTVEPGNSTVGFIANQKHQVVPERGTPTRSVKEDGFPHTTATVAGLPAAHAAVAVDEDSVTAALAYAAAAVPTSVPATVRAVTTDAHSCSKSGASVRCDSDSSTCTEKHYPIGATHYVFGEIYFGLTDEHKVQKLLQVERMLQFLLTKEGRSSILDCVAGVLFIGTFNAKGRAAMHRSLEHYRSALPLLCQLCASKRLLAIRVKDDDDAPLRAYSAAVELEELKKALAAARADAERAEAARRTDMESWEARFAALAAQVQKPQDGRLWGFFSRVFLS